MKDDGQCFRFHDKKCGGKLMTRYKIIMTNLRLNSDFCIVIVASSADDAEQKMRLKYRNGAYRFVAIETL